MKTIIFIKDYKDRKKGEIETMGNNVAHGLLELGVAQIYIEHIEKLLKKEIRKPPVDKMMKPSIDKRTNKDKYEIK